MSSQKSKNQEIESSRPAVHESSVDEARERLDFVPRKEFDALQTEVLELRQRLERLEGASAPRLSEGETGGSFVID